MPSNPQDTLRRRVWKNDRLLLDKLLFRLEQVKSDDASFPNGHFRFFKDRELVNQYAEFWGTHPDYSVQRMVELGIWDSGSAVFWFECFHPHKYLAFDIGVNKDSPYFSQYVTDNNLSNRLKTYWGVDQADGVTLRRLIRSEVNQPLDVIIDDASHQYLPTKASAEYYSHYYDWGNVHH